MELDRGTDVEFNEPHSVAESLAEAFRPRPAAPGFHRRPMERTNALALPAWFIDSCRRAYLSVPFAEDGNRIVGVTSAQYGEGKTSVALGIATALAADTREPTLVMECDMERPSVADFLGIPEGPGLSDWLSEAAPLRVLQLAPLDNAFILPAGNRTTDGARLIYRLSESEVIAELRPRFRNIVLDLPPLLNIAYSSLACKLAEHILLVARYGQTSMADVQKSAHLLGRERLTGVVLNGHASKVPGWIRRLL